MLIRWQRERYALVAALALTLLSSSRVGAIYLDDQQNVSFRARIYSQLGIRAQDTAGPNANPDTQTFPRQFSGQMVQNRNFYNPELEAKLVSYTDWMREIPSLSWLAPDAFDFRLAAWGFYDGIFDYGSGQFDAARRAPIVVQPGQPKTILVENPQNKYQPTTATVPCTRPQGCIVGTIYNRSSTLPGGGSYEDVARNINLAIERGIAMGVPPEQTLNQLFPSIDAREEFAHDQRINELYLSYTKGPLFVRLGRQSISWGESDTIALLDQNNPFDVKLDIPGLFQDLDEARIPLWTLRSTLQLFNTLGPLSSGFIEGYWVPGDIDTSVVESPFPLNVSPYTPPGQEPHVAMLRGFARMNIPIPSINAVIADQTSLVLVDRTPKQSFKNSRVGVRLQSVVGREHTVSAWYYNTFGNQPVPVLIEPGPSNFYTLTETTRALTQVFGIADTFFLEPVDTIVRLEAEYFLGEPGTILYAHADGTPVPQSVPVNVPEDGRRGVMPRANHLRWETGFDRFFFIRALNPTNSFILVTALVGDYNLDATSNKVFALAPNYASRLHPFEGIWQMTMQTDYLHGTLTPAVTAIANWEGAVAVNLQADYRFTDWLIARLQYTTINGAFHQLGTFRDHDQIALRLTYQLN